MEDSKFNQLPADAVEHAQPTPSIGKVKLNSKGFGRAVTSVAVEQELWDWFCDQTTKKNKPKSKDVSHYYYLVMLRLFTESS